MTDKETLIIVKAAMIMLNTYLDLMGSAEILEIAAKEAGREKIEDLIFTLTDTDVGTSKEINECKAELVLSRMRNTASLAEVN